MQFLLKLQKTISNRLEKKKHKKCEIINFCKINYKMLKRLKKGKSKAFKRLCQKEYRGTMRSHPFQRNRNGKGAFSPMLSRANLPVTDTRVA